MRRLICVPVEHTDYNKLVNMAVDLSTLSGATILVYDRGIIPDSVDCKDSWMLSWAMNDARERALRDLDSFDIVSYCTFDILSPLLKIAIREPENFTMDGISLYIHNNPYKPQSQHALSAKYDLIEGDKHDMFLLGGVYEYGKFMKESLENATLATPIEEIMLCSFIRNMGIRTEDLSHET